MEKQGLLLIGLTQKKMAFIQLATLRFAVDYCDMPFRLHPRATVWSNLA